MNKTVIYIGIGLIVVGGTIAIVHYKPFTSQKRNWLLNNLGGLSSVIVTQYTTAINQMSSDEINTMYISQNGGSPIVPGSAQDLAYKAIETKYNLN